jgi:hypothetical protein
MDNSLIMAYTVITAMKYEGRSALPDAPVEVEGRPGPAARRPTRLLGWLAGALHRAAWAIEPPPRSVAEARE